jgi:sulfur transfer protein SufE
MMIKGLAALFVRLINGQEPAAVANISLDFIDRISVSKLASNRNNGLLAMLDHIKNKAKRLSEQHQIAEKGIS